MSHSYLKLEKIENYKDSIILEYIVSIIETKNII